MIKIEVDLGDRSYPIHIGSGALANISTNTKVESRQIMVVTNETVAPILLKLYPFVKIARGRGGVIQSSNMFDWEELSEK